MERNLILHAVVILIFTAANIVKILDVIIVDIEWLLCLTDAEINSA
ncbi:hypothetical protein [Pedobacter ureilyticus]|jgi:hypothetical protein|uniref:Uncharacterized protein n=1 Tax=Pedobacter ureilyticus TaxID=1393051 RepID=A0ABW9JDH1_9SPHI